VSVIKDDGSVKNLSGSAYYYVDFTSANEILAKNSGDSLEVISVDTTDTTANYYTGLRYYNGNPATGYRPLLHGNGGKIVSSGDNSFAYSGINVGLQRYMENTSDPRKGSAALVTADYNTGWMNGDIKLAALSDTDDTDVVGSELVTNGDGSTITGWTAYNSVISSVGGKLRVNDSASAGSWSSAVQELTGMVSGKLYTLSMDVDIVSGTSAHFGLNGDATTAPDRQIDSSLGSGTYTSTFTADEHNYIYVGTGGTGTVDLSNISVRLAERDRSVNGNGLQIHGTIDKDPVATGADLVAYSGFSSSNYLEQPYNSDLDFGTGDFCFMGWVKGNSQMVLQRGDMRLEFQSSKPRMLLRDSSSNTLTYISATEFDTATWRCLTIVKSGTTGSMFIDGVLSGSVTNASIGSFTEADAVTTVGNRNSHTEPFNGSLALWRISATAPTAEQIKKIYEDEKVLFQENAKATLYGSSDAVTALAHDDSTNLLHVGTSAGRSVFQGLKRVSNTTDAVGTCISASNDLVVEE